MKKQLAILISLLMIVQSLAMVTVFAAGGSGTEADPFVIETVDELKAMSGGKYYKLANDLDFDGIVWKPYESKARLDGNGHKIINLSLDTTAKNQGIFSKLTNGSVKNLVIDESCSFVSSTSTIAALAGLVINSTIENVINNADVTGGGNTGGIAGSADAKSTITNCVNKGNITGKNSNGGIVGVSNGTITDCVNYGFVDSTLSSTYIVGGIAGSFAGGTLDNCTNYGAVQANKSVGGIAGSVSSGLTVNNCKNHGNITAGYRSVGGIVGSINLSTVNGCYNNGEIYAIGDYAGGITGAASEKAFAPSNSINVINCINEGKVYSPGTHVAGISPWITGTSEKPSVISKCVSNGWVCQASKTENEDGSIVIAPSNKAAGGGIVGRMLGVCIVEDCYSYSDNEHLGGIVGRCINEKIDKSDRSVDNVKIINCYSYGSSYDAVAIAFNNNDTVEVSNVYYCSEKDSAVEAAEKVTEEQLKSGEVAWLLNKNHKKTEAETTETTEIVDEVETTVTTTTISIVSETAYVWSQGEKAPVFADEENRPVYKYTVNYTDGSDDIYYKPAQTDSLKAYVAQYVDGALKLVKSKQGSFADELSIDTGAAKDEGNTVIMFWNGIIPLCEKIEK